jgi:hypothetical protein
MIGFITDQQTADAVIGAIKNAEESRGLSYFWTIGQYPIYNGEYAGSVFLPFDETIMETIVYRGMTPMDFPESQILIEELGGLDARVDLDPQAIVFPDIE